MNIPTALFHVSVVALLLTGCNRADVSIDPEAWRDASLPNATDVFAQRDAADRARIAALPVVPVVAIAPVVVPPVKGKKMTNTEELKAMPMPGQVNDHSSTQKNK